MSVCKHLPIGIYVFFLVRILHYYDCLLLLFFSLFAARRRRINTFCFVLLLLFFKRFDEKNIKSWFGRYSPYGNRARTASPRIIIHVYKTPPIILYSVRVSSVCCTRCYFRVLLTRSSGYLTYTTKRGGRGNNDVNNAVIVLIGIGNYNFFFPQCRCAYLYTYYYVIWKDDAQFIA